jgi:membrane protein implicated in regulation of membrane protease activity
MSEASGKKHRGVATLFETSEIKKYFKNYLILIGFAEAFIFFVSFVSQLGPENIPFPWRSYFFAAFIVPVAITFILGLCIVGFNSYLYGDSSAQAENVIAFPQDSPSRGYLYKFQLLLYSIRQIPLLLGLILLGLCAGIIYKIDAILMFIGHAGEKTAQYLLLSLAVLLGVAAVFSLIWLVLNYKLRKKTMEYQYRYRRDVIEHTGMIILDDRTVIDREGNVMTHDSLPDTRNEKEQKNKLALLPKISGKKEQPHPPRETRIS